jgi:hypothetical protein
MRLVLTDQESGVEIRVEMISTFDEALDGFVLMRFDAIHDQTWGGIGSIEAFVEVITRVKFAVLIDELALDAQGGVLEDARDPITTVAR